MKQAVNLLALAVLTLFVVLTAMVVSRTVAQRGLGPSAIRSPLGIEFQIDAEGTVSHMVVSNPADEEVRTLQLVIYTNERKETVTIDDVTVPPHNVVVVDLSKRVDASTLKSANMIEVYYGEELVARRVIG